MAKMKKMPPFKSDKSNMPKNGGKTPAKPMQKPKPMKGCNCGGH